MTLTQPVAAAAARDRAALLARLYADQFADGRTADACGYLRSHARPGAIGHHVNVFEWYAPRIAPGSTVLDWGCNHGPDSCLLLHKFGERIDLHACDFGPEGAFAAFRAAARPRYRQLSDPRVLPYEDETFEVVVGSGTLEHTAMDGEALKEVYRVLRPDGLLVVTYLPHAYSWAEWRERRAGAGHRRLYTRRGFDRLLRAHGFVSDGIELQGFVPNRLRGPRGGALAAVLGPLLDAVVKPLVRPFRYPPFAHSVLCATARKVVVM
ncbi:MAG: class I SAM-dependent methyltransferase [Planctomycetes bacterium]|nr:class I SAM-dependent methyltransferase [Planctomycetota bacterium]